MFDRIRRPLGVVLATACLLVAAAQALAQQATDSVLERPLATRASLETLERRLSHRQGAVAAETAMLARVRARLEEGDFRQGDQVLLEVQGEPALSDTFTVGPGVELKLPSPTVGSLSLRGVLRSELQHEMERYLGRFLVNPVVRARSLILLSIQGEVQRAGMHGIAADAVLAEALRAAGGTTQRADMEETHLEREGESILDGRTLQRALAAGLTLDELYLRDGDQIIVARDDGGGFREGLRFMWIIVSLAGGIYGLSQAL